MQLCCKAPKTGSVEDTPVARGSVAESCVCCVVSLPYMNEGERRLAVVVVVVFCGADHLHWFAAKS